MTWVHVAIKSTASCLTVFTNEMGSESNTSSNQWKFSTRDMITEGYRLVIYHSELENGPVKMSWVVPSNMMIFQSYVNIYRSGISINIPILIIHYATLLTTIDHYSQRVYQPYLEIIHGLSIYKPYYDPLFSGKTWVLKCNHWNLIGISWRSEICSPPRLHPASSLKLWKLSPWWSRDEV